MTILRAGVVSTARTRGNRGAAPSPGLTSWGSGQRHPAQMGVGHRVSLQLQVIPWLWQAGGQEDRPRTRSAEDQRGSGSGLPGQRDPVRVFLHFNKQDGWVTGRAAPQNTVPDAGLGIPRHCHLSPGILSFPPFKHTKPFPAVENQGVAKRGPCLKEACLQLPCKTAGNGALLSFSQGS